MKRFLLLTLPLALMPLAALAQAGPAGNVPLVPGSPTQAVTTPAGSDISGGPNSPGAPNPSPAPRPGAAAAGVPLPGQPATGPTLEKSLPLIPQPVPGGHGQHQAAPGATPREPATFKTEEDIRMRIRIREAENRAQTMPDVQALWLGAHQAPTERKRRALIAKYYNLLYDRMIKLDPGIAERANLRRQTLIARLRYTRLGESNNSEDPFVAPPPVVAGPNPPPGERSTSSAPQE
ncbi:MAG TPA: hypothetical protein VHY22_19030 [Chthoniobacteraceae bacterium]|jgi:hypothetical protein|nr:hypothetical protein [Chthoniobacteraceae bacterium]